MEVKWNKQNPEKSGNYAELPEFPSLEEDNIDKTGFYVINSETEVAVRLRHEETGNDVTVRVNSVTPILDDTFKKELVELVKRLINPLC